MRRDTCQDIYYAGCDIINLLHIIQFSEEWDAFQTSARNARLKDAINEVKKIMGMMNSYNYSNFESNYRKGNDITEKIKWELNTIRASWGLLYDEYSNIRRCWENVLEKKGSMEIITSMEPTHMKSVGEAFGFAEVNETWYKAMVLDQVILYDSGGTWEQLYFPAKILLF